MSIRDTSASQTNEMSKDIQNNSTEIASFLAEDEEISRVSMKQQINRLFKLTLHAQEKSRNLSTSSKREFL